MNFLFRIDAGGDLGLGNFFRSLTLAENLKAKGHNIIFHHNDSSFWSLKKKLNDFHFLSIGIYEKTEIEIILENDINVFYVDGNIKFSKVVIKEIKKHCKVIFFQNLSNSRKYADIFIFPSLSNFPEFFKSFTRSTKIYKGLEYCLFNSKVSSLNFYSVNTNYPSIGIIAGGSDPTSCLSKIFNLIDFNLHKNIDFVFFKGKDNIGCLKSISNYIKNQKKDYVRVKISDFDHNQILSCSLIISVFGVSTYEFLSLRMPILSIAHNEKTLKTLNDFASKTKSLYNLGYINELCKDELNQVISNFITNKKELVFLSKKTIDVFDFRGTERVAKILLNE